MILSRDDAVERDRADPLADYLRRFVPTEPDLVYFDGNSLGRPPAAAVEELSTFVRDAWGDRLIRGWDEGWMGLPYALGDRLGAAALGAAAGQTAFGDSTTVWLYKLARAAVDTQQAGDPRRTEIVADSADFPTDRFVVEAIAAERGCRVVWLDTGEVQGVTADLLAVAVSDRTALVLLSHVDYRTAHVADAATLTATAHAVGAFILLDLCHAAGLLPLHLDEWQVDLAVGCGYKYLSGGPGAPAFGYVRRELQDTLTQPIQGWMGAADVFAMGPRYEPGGGMRRFVSGTPAILALAAIPATLTMIELAGIDAVRAKSVELTEYAIALSDELLAPLGVRLGSPRDASRRGGHIILIHPAMRAVAEALRARSVLPDFRNPDGLRIGLSPLSTSFTEVWEGLQRTREELCRLQ